MAFTQLTELTKKNQEFIHIATNQLIEDGKSNEEIKALLEEILPTIMEQQKRGITARSLYGPPSEWAASHSQPSSSLSTETRNENPWLMWLDSSLLILAILGIFSGVLNLVGNGASYGILTFLLIGCGVGGGMYLMYYKVYRHINQGQRPKMFTSIFYLLLTTILWSLIFFVTSFIPSSINPILNPIVSILIGSLSFGARYFLKNKYNIQTAMQVNRPQNRS